MKNYVAVYTVATQYFQIEINLTGPAPVGTKTSRLDLKRNGVVSQLEG